MNYHRKVLKLIRNFLDNSIRNALQWAIARMSWQYLDFIVEKIDDRADRISVHWNVDDVAMSLGYDSDEIDSCKYDRNDLMEALYLAHENHDANYGITWEALRKAANTLGLDEKED